MNCKKVIGSFGHRFAKSTISLVAPDELSRKKAVSSYYAVKFWFHNKRRVMPDHTAEELLSWQRVMDSKVKYSKEIYRGNSLYGAGRALREYAGILSPLKACIEHGLYLGNYANPLELDKSGLPAIVTFGPARARHIRDSSSVPILAVGPYIAYAEDYLAEDQMARAKQMLGRTLLAFPSHSVDYIKKRFDVPRYIEHLKARAEDEGMDTVLVSLYFADVLNGAAEPYERAGFKVVTSGYREDSNFLPRLRSLILLADSTSSNSMGTHIGYCVYLGRPHCVFQQDWIAKGVTKADNEHVVAACSSARGIEERCEIIDAFTVPFDGITERQLKVCDKYWGFECVKSSEELVRYFDLLERASAQSGCHLPLDIAESLEKMTLSSLGFSRVSADLLDRDVAS